MYCRRVHPDSAQRAPRLDRRSALQAILLAVTLLGAGFACAYDIVSGEIRTALVIGNANYKNAPLKNPVNDAQAVAAELKLLGFHVILREDTTQRELFDAMRDFSRRAAKSQVRLLYYAGHGVQLKGRNYLMPVDAEVQTEEEIVLKGADITELLERLGTLPGGVNLIVLDACRNNPFVTSLAQLADSRRVRTRGLGPQASGLAPVQAPSGTLIAFATAPGSVAIDNPQQKNSVYTKHLLANLRTPNVPIERMFKQVRVAVAQETQQQQVPWETSSLMGEFCFRTDATGKCTG